MRTCNNCFWCRFSWEMLENSKAKKYKCKHTPTKRFNYPKLRGWFCKNYIKEKGE